MATLTRSIDVSRVVVRPFDGFIFMCGGRIPDGDDSPLSSVRHFATRRLRSTPGSLAEFKVILAERATDLLRDGSFPDLLEFEEHLAALAACVLLFVESPGSIAELGSFAVMPQLRPKVLVVFEQSHSTAEDSFIVLGPLASLKRRDPTSVQVFPMHVSSDGNLQPSPDLIEQCWEDIEVAVSKFTRRPIQENPFDASALAHQLVLLVELTSLFGALRRGELHDCIKQFGVALAVQHLDRSLKVLAKFGLIHIREWGNEKFYIGAADRQLLRLRRTEGDLRPFDPLRFVADRIEEYATSDPAKAKALRSFRRETGRS